MPTYSKHEKLLNFDVKKATRDSEIVTGNP